jgi:predicted PurR-regulated permease PerM
MSEAEPRAREGGGTYTGSLASRTVAWFVGIGAGTYALVVAKDLLIPLVLAIFLWLLIGVVTDAFARIPVGKRTLPRPLAFAASLLIVVVGIMLISNLVGTSLYDVAKAAPAYQERFQELIAAGFERFGIEEPRTVREMLDELDLSTVITTSAAWLAGLVGRTGLVAVYLVFLFIEQRLWGKKIEALAPDPERRKNLLSVLSRIRSDTAKYVGVKSATSFLTAALGYLVMKMVGLDYAAFWALLLFILNFIPNIGSIVATALPSLVALLQFDTLGRFFIVLGGIAVVQFLVAYVVEPRAIGQALNMSPLVILLSLVVWWTLWGIAGMFLCVPIMVIGMIVLARFPQTRPIAILMSKDGEFNP